MENSMNHKGTITIETKRLILRQFVESDVLATFNNWTSDEKITEFLRWQMHSSIEVTENIVKEWISLYNNKDFYQWAIVLKEYNNETIGTISVVDKNEKLNILHIGYCIGSNWWNKGITTGFGNTSAKQGAENTLRLIKLSNCGYDVPVAVGAEYNLDGECDPAPKHIHGDNGIGNVDLPESDQKILNEPAEDFIIRKANELNGDLIIVTLGRLTNIAKALEKDPRLPYKVKNVISMGGCLNKPGNITPYAEANIYGDARASDIVVSAGFHMMLVPYVIG